MTEERIYLAIDLKSFYASVECVERGLDALTTNLVVADSSRTDKTICLAVTPSLKELGISGRPRLFEVEQRIRDVNAERRFLIPSQTFKGKSFSATELRLHSDWEVDYVVASPRMALYVEYSKRIYQIYLKYVAEDDIHIYSVDEVFMDVTQYLHIYKMTPRQLVMEIIRDVLRQTGITATAGIGTNLYLAKVAMDIVAKHIPPDKNGVRIAELDELSYRKLLWNHRPLTDFWRVGAGTAKKLEKYNVCTMGQVARLSIDREDFFYRLFGVNAELLIDHAWGWEPCSMANIKAYRPGNRSICNGQVLNFPYDSRRAQIVVQEMAEMIVWELLDKQLMTNQLHLSIGYESLSPNDVKAKKVSQDNLSCDRYGRLVPKGSHGSISLNEYTSSLHVIEKAVDNLYERIIDSQLPIRRLALTANHIKRENELVKLQRKVEQLNLFGTENINSKESERTNMSEAKEKRKQECVLNLKLKFGKNTVLRGKDLQNGATMKERNRQIGGHKA